MNFRSEGLKVIIFFSSLKQVRFTSSAGELNNQRPVLGRVKNRAAKREFGISFRAVMFFAFSQFDKINVPIETTIFRPLYRTRIVTSILDYVAEFH
jgi:hypothetical protein